MIFNQEQSSEFSKEGEKLTPSIVVFEEEKKKSKKKYQGQSEKSHPLCMKTKKQKQNFCPLLLDVV